MTDVHAALAAEQEPNLHESCRTPLQPTTLTDDAPSSHTVTTVEQHNEVSEARRKLGFWAVSLPKNR